MHEDDLLNGLRNAGERLDYLSQPVDPHAARRRAAPGTPARRGVRAGVAVAAAVALVGLIGAVALRDDESQVTMIDDPVTTSTSTTSGAASAPPCPVIDERSPRVGDQVLGVVPPGFTAGVVTEGGDGRAVDAGGTSTYTLRLDGPNDAVIEVTTFSTFDPGALIGSVLGESRGATVETPDCAPSAGEEAPPRTQLEWAEANDRIAVGAQQWEWGGFYITGTQVDLATLLEVAGGLRNVPPEDMGRSGLAALEEQPLDFGSLGPIRTGMTIDEVQAAAATVVREDRLYPDIDCGTWFPSDITDLSFLALEGKLAVITAQGAFRTSRGIGVGSSRQDVLDAYAREAVEERTNSFGVDQLVVTSADPADPGLGILFSLETNSSQRVETIATGHVDALDRDEGCA